jgi:hypothetical protein
MVMLFYLSARLPKWAFPLKSKQNIFLLLYKRHPELLYILLYNEAEEVYQVYLVQ